MLNWFKNNQSLILTTTVILTVLFAVVFLFGHIVSAQVDYGVDFAADVGLSSDDIRVSAVRIIRTVLGFLGILTLIIIIYGGVVWMTSRGRSDRVALAKKILLNATIGLIIILLAFGIVQYIFSTLFGSQGGPPGDACTAGDRRGSCELCVTPPDQGYWQWQYTWPGCDIGASANSFILNDVQTSHAGANNKDDVYWCSKVQNIFNRNLNPNTVTAAHTNPPIITDSLRIAAETAPAVFNQVADGNWQTRGNVVTFTPSGNEFANRNTSHRENLPQSLEDVEGRFLSDCSLTAGCEGTPPPDYHWNFYVGSQGDNINPSITTTYPQSSDLGSPDLNVSIDPILEVNFSEAIDATSLLDINGINPYPGRIYLEELDTNGVVVNTLANNILIVQMNNNGTGFTIHLQSPNLLQAFTYYQLTVQDIQDLCGNTMLPSSRVWQFATNDQQPGINTYYPTGSNACPDTRISVSFNTSMYNNTVRIRISNVVNTWNYALNPSLDGQTSIADANGEFRILDIGSPLSTHYMIYEFVPAVALSENSTYNIYIETDKIINVSGAPLIHSWDFTVTDLDNCVCTPHINSLSRSQGPVGECLTISGYCFTGTAAQPATIDYINFDATPATIGSGYSSSAVGTSVPAGFTANDRPQVSLAINYASGNNVPASNQQEFLVTAGTASGPCLWSVQPDYGPRGLTGLRLTGDRFGDADTTRQVVFTPQANAVFNVPANDWTDQSIQSIVVPATTQDGEVIVRNDQGTSNGIYFDVSYCGDGVINAGEECDAANLSGRDCTDFGFVGGNLSCDSICQFDSSSCSNAPNVVANGLCQLACNGGINDGQLCYTADDCPSGSCDIDILPSPNPYRNETQACLNAVISADFNTDINPTTLNNTNIFIQECNDDNCNTFNPTHLSASLTPAGSRSFRLTPSANLDLDTTYQVSLLNNIASQAGIQMENDYIWHFKTKNDSADCPIERVYVEPRNNLLGANQTDNTYNASAVASFISTNCSLINSNSYDWLWSISQPDLGVSVIEALNDDSNASVLTDIQQGNVRVIAETESRQAWGDLTISFDTCAFRPEVCNENCPGSVCDIDQDRCTPVVTSINPNTGPTGRWSTVQGCYFKSARGSGRVDFGSTPVSVYPCNEVWSDTEIIVGVPAGLSSGDYAVQVTDRYGLASNTDNSFSVIDQCLAGIPIPADGVPGLCTINPDNGMPGSNFHLTGENFSDTQSIVNFDGAPTTINSWANQNINAQVPNPAVSSSVAVSLNSCPSNSLFFSVLSGDVNDPCDSDSGTPECEANSSLCWPGLYCESTSCTCQPVPNANVIASTQYPYPYTECPNTAVTATFDQLMDRATLNARQIELWARVGATDPGRAECLSQSQMALNIQPAAKDSLFQRILTKLKRLFRPIVKAQVDPWWCPIGGWVSSQNINDQTAFTFNPYKPLNGSNVHQVIIHGGPDGVKSSLGGELNTNGTSQYFGDHYYWNFTVGAEICLIDHVDINVTFNSATGPITRQDASYDYFLCAGRDDCPDDVGAPGGNQHEYVAQARDANNVPLSTAYAWTEQDDQNLIQLSLPTTIPNNLITPNPFDGESIARVTVFDLDYTDDIRYGTSTAAVTITNSLCQNPWPSLTTFPYQDADMDFSTYYCRDYGHDQDYCLGGDNDGLDCEDDTNCPGGQCLGPTTDDLPALRLPATIRPEASGYCVGGSEHGASCAGNTCSGGYCHNVIREIMFFYNQGWCSRTGILCYNDGNCSVDETCEINNDSIGMRIYRNDEHLSPSSWYQKYANQPGAYSTKQVDGYQAIASGRTTYVNFAVGNPPAYTDMFLLSYTDNYQPVTLNIHDQLLKNLKFNTSGIDNARVCTNGAYCEKDSDCPVGETCNAQKLKLTRDVIRLGALSEMIYHLELHRGECSAHSNLACLDDSDCPDDDPNNAEFCIIKNNAYPALEAGTYLAGQSVSVWDSWNQTFASLLGTSLLLDPLNEIMCDQAAGYNQECWNKDVAADQRFYCGPGSHIYHYSAAGNTYNIYLNMEYSSAAWSPSPVLGSFFQGGFAQPCSPGAYNFIFTR